MPNTKISALTAAAQAALANEFPINEAGVSKKVSGTQLRALIGPTLISGATGNANAAAAPSETWQVLTSNASTNSTTTNAVVMTTSAIPIGTYFFRYDILVQAGATTTSVKFAVDYTGTVTNIQYRLLFPSAGVSASTGAADQEVNATTGNVYGLFATRIDNTTLGPGTDLDAANSNVHMTIEGVMVVSTSADLTLAHGSEVAAASTVQAGTMLQLRRLV